MHNWSGGYETPSPAEMVPDPTLGPAGGPFGTVAGSSGDWTATMPPLSCCMVWGKTELPFSVI